ncbi:MAG: BTAD domain-containing putative transcriptional regulator [Gemmatimonadetes bacterium]|nr:BTAD domain-containing putative transcriptional regulator [Gemmatimonadota bacterium]
MTASPYRTVLPLLAAATLACIPGCTASSLSVRFDIHRSPLLGLPDQDATIAFLGFNGTDLALNNLTGYLFARALVSDSTLAAIEMRPVLRTLARHPHEAGQVSDSLALVVGREMNAGIAVVGDLDRAYTEEYGEVKVFREEETVGVRLGGSNVRVINKAYVLPHIDQTAAVTTTLRVYGVRSKMLIGSYTVTESQSYRTVLPEPVEAPPEGAVSVEFVSPMLTEVLARRIVDRLMASLVREQIQVTRRLIATPDRRALSAARGGDWSRAVTIWEGTVAEDPHDAAAWNNLAVAYERSGRRGDAEAAYHNALSASPGDRTIRSNNRAFGRAADDRSDR